MVPKNHKPGTNTEAAFARRDLLAVILAVSVLALLVVAWTGRAKQVTKESVCMDNLKNLGIGMAMYAAENNAKLPIAAVHYSDRDFIVWDKLIASQIRTELHRQNPEERKLSTADVGQMFSCPADTVPRAAWSYFNRKRSYSMTDHNMEPANWPPAAANATGVGLWWSWRFNGPHDLTKYTSAQGPIPGVRMDMIQEPKATILVTEMLSGRNTVIANGAHATVSTTAEQLDPQKLPPAQHHNGKFNYLMVDGHVEFLAPEKTVGSGKAGSDPRQHKGMWTIKAKD